VRDPGAPAPLECRVCGGTTFEHGPVLWPALVAEWGLSGEEARYIDVQQGTRCAACGSNVRSNALASAILRWRGVEGPLSRFVRDRAQKALRVLEINEAGTLHGVLSELPGLRLVSYPEYDILSLPFEAGAFDLVVHSDTLEHVADPVRGLQECRRLVDRRGAVAFTVPTVVGRLSRSREGLPASYHGGPGREDPAMRVHTEFGADAWTFVMRAGFASCELVAFNYPAGLAVVAHP
jgi:SAM-dependent methyltransferase